MKLSKGLSVILLLVGIAAIVLSIICFAQDSGYGAGTSNTYGADFYTDVQRAAAKSAENIRQTNKILKFGFGSLLVVLGVVLSAIGIDGLCKKEPIPVVISEKPAPQVFVPQEPARDVNKLTANKSAAELGDMLSKGLITPDEYQKKLAELLNQAN